MFGEQGYKCLKTNDNPGFNLALSLMALSRINQTTLSSSDEKKNMLGKAARSLQVLVAQSRMSKFIGAMLGGVVSFLVPHTCSMHENSL